MHRQLIACSVVVHFALGIGACSSADEPDASGRTEQLAEAVQCKDFRISSPAFRDGAKLPDAYTCEGKPFSEGISPKLEWTKGPRGTKSYAVVFKDLSIIDGPFPDRAFHWAIWDIPHSRRDLPTALPAGQFPEGIKNAQQLSGYPPAPYQYFGPCPSWENFCSAGSVPRSLDSYSFTIYALDTKTLELPAPDPNIGNYVRQLDAYLQSVSIGEAELHTQSDARPSSFPFCP